MTTYGKAGVDIELGDVCSKIMSAAADRTFSNRRGKSGVVKVLEKKGLHRIITISLKGLRLLLNSDGIGTKVEFAERTGKHDTMAYDLFAMLCDDAVRYGAEPVAISNILDVNILNRKTVEELAEGMVKASKDAGVTVVSGEIAELGKRVKGYGTNSYNWGGTVLSIFRKDLTGNSIKKGSAIVALEEKGFRSNGISLVRKIMEKTYGPEWHREKIGRKTLGEQALAPSRIYTRAVIEMFNYISSVIHITGGGIPGKMGRLLEKRKIGADISSPFYPCELMLLCQKLGGVEDEEAYRTWNMGQGMLLVTDRPEKVVAIASKYKIRAKVAGEITGRPGIRITSKGYFKPDRTIRY
jgi:phosphoribosylformylglycinamidine cyclo-ligase